MADPLENDERLGMSAEQWAWFQAHTQGFGDQDENGVDLSLLRENLRLTPLQRLEKLQGELRSLKALLESEPPPTSG